MNKIFDRTKLAFLGIFAVAVVAIWGYQYFYVWPGQRCEAMGRWWAPEQRACGVPINVVTGLPLATSPSAAPQRPAAAPPPAASAKPAP
jgi:hypothetical protein